ncbi:type II toxin-antitoxin system HicA family toxin [Rubinisphaera italica]|uniref:YcfA-like protein n=1 Tax=Rubinisphaera italica TaxID=2527969 RepID=A0A5C5XHP6_9PLAN|nr:type II toxin-antitoxin system HicA family toxin [Rubinisphaera italica]TWT62229.1 YcfA-like protein [Rubinisphaera italica]
MATKIPRISGKKAIKAFQKAGFEVVRTKGSHHIMNKEDHPSPLNIPVHGNEDMGIGLLKKQITLAGLSVEQFIEYLNS